MSEYIKQNKITFVIFTAFSDQTFLRVWRVASLPPPHPRCSSVVLLSGRGPRQSHYLRSPVPVRPASRARRQSAPLHVLATASQSESGQSASRPSSLLRAPRPSARPRLCATMWTIPSFTIYSLNGGGSLLLLCTVAIVFFFSYIVIVEPHRPFFLYKSFKKL